MHQQIRTVPAMSPPNLQEFLQVLLDAGINMEAAGGSNIEQGGEFAFAVAHGQEEEALIALKHKGYAPRLVDVTHCALTNEPGQLLACITDVTTSNNEHGRVIKDIVLGVPDEDGRIQIQIYSV